MCNFSILLVFVINLFYHIHAQKAANEDWKLNDIVGIFSDGVNNAKNKPVSTAFAELTKKAASEFEKLYHQLEGVLKQLTTKGPVKITQLDPSVVNDECNCYCRCPHDTVSSKVIDDVKVKVMDLKERFIRVGKSIKEKIHDLTSR